MTHASARRAEPLPLLLTAAFAGAVVLAFSDAPQSVGMMFRIGIDNVDFAGEQLVVAVFGAIGTAAGVLLARWWRLLLAVGALGVLVAHLMHNVGWSGLKISVAESLEPGQNAVPPDFAQDLFWACLLVGSSGLLLIGVLGAAQRIYRAHPVGASVVAVAACAGYLGVSVVGPLRGVDAGTGRLVVLVIAVLLVGGALLDRELAEPAGPPGPLPLPAQLAAAGAVLLTVTPTAAVAITGDLVFGTWVGGVLGLVITAGAVAAAALVDLNTIIATAAAGLAMAAVTALWFMFADALVAGDEGTSLLGLLGLIGVAVAAVVAAQGSRLPLAAGVLTFTALLLAGLAAGLFDFAEDAGGFIIWLVLIASIAAVGSAAGSIAPFLANRAALPAAGAIITAMALGINGILNLTRISEPDRPNLEMIFGTGGFLIAAGMLVVAAGLLILLSRQDRVRTTGPVDDYRRVFTSFAPAPGPTPPESR